MGGSGDRWHQVRATARWLGRLGSRAGLAVLATGCYLEPAAPPEAGTAAGEPGALRVTVAWEWPATIPPAERPTRIELHLVGETASIEADPLTTLPAGAGSQARQIGGMPVGRYNLRLAAYSEAGQLLVEVPYEVWLREAATTRVRAAVSLAGAGRPAVALLAPETAPVGELVALAGAAHRRGQALTAARWTSGPATFTSPLSATAGQWLCFPTSGPHEVRLAAGEPAAESLCRLPLEVRGERLRLVGFQDDAGTSWPTGNVRGARWICATVDGETLVTHADCYLDGLLLGRLTSPGARTFRWAFDAAAVGAGEHRLRLVAERGDGSILTHESGFCVGATAQSPAAPLRVQPARLTLQPGQRWRFAANRAVQWQPSGPDSGAALTPDGDYVAPLRPGAQQVRATASDGPAETVVVAIRVVASSPAVGRVESGDGAALVAVPAGPFLMGSPPGTGAADEQPQRQIHLEAYRIHRCEVTNGQYATFLNARRPTPGELTRWIDFSDPSAQKIQHRGGAYRVESGFENRPVTLVTWYGAEAYATHYGMLLPTEAQWEKAARGSGDARQYPWGPAWDAQRANAAGVSGADCWPGTAPVTSFANGASPYGALQMAGNVWEWCRDRYWSGWYRHMPADSPVNASIGNCYVARGGSWLYAPSHLRVTTRIRRLPSGRDYTIGFRCVAAATPPAAPAKVSASGGAVAVPLAAPARASASDGAAMVPIPAGEFTMGSPPGSGPRDEQPRRRIYLDGYRIHRCEVTNGQYAAFLNARGPSPRELERWIHLGAGDQVRIVQRGGAYRVVAGWENHPVVRVSWFGATAYAEHYGLRLPTEAQWEKAARGTTDSRAYPWGDQADSDGARAIDPVGTAGGETTAPVGQSRLDASPFGVLDLAGNAQEWCRDWYHAAWYRTMPRANPENGKLAPCRVVRGGCWLDLVRQQRLAERAPRLPLTRDGLVGFRCVAPW